MSVIVENRFTSNGYECEVRIVGDDYYRYRCGYVLIDESHPLYGVNGSELPADFKPKVNGGITYSTKEGDKWVFGFDYGHCWNIPDPKITDYTHPRFDENDIPDTLANAMGDCINLADALKAYEGKEYVWTIDDWGFMSERKPSTINLQGTIYIPVEGKPCKKGYIPCLLNIPCDPKDDKEAKWMLEGIRTGQITAEFYVSPSYAMKKED